MVVTHSTYAARPVDLGDAAGIDIQGYVIGGDGCWGRELLYRVRGLGEAIVRPSVTGGRQIPITGDGRALGATLPPGYRAAGISMGGSTGPE